MADEPSPFRPKGFTMEEAEVCNNIVTCAEDLYSELTFTLMPSRETSIAFTKLEEAIMWAKRSIAKNGVRGE